MKDIAQLVANDPWLMLFVLSLSVLGMLYFRRRLLGLQAAERIVREQSFPATQEEINQLIDEFKDNEVRARVLREFTRIRQTYGHKGVKKGHIFWVLLKIDKGLPEGGEIPSFSERKS